MTRYSPYNYAFDKPDRSDMRNDSAEIFSVPAKHIDKVYKKKAHELKHMYQFETGETALGLTKNNGGISLKGNNLLFYDLSDEVQAYQRGALFGQRENVNSVSDILSKGVYSDKIPSGPINAVNYPNAAGIKQNPQSFANKYNAAFRIGTTTYKPQ